MHVYVIVHKSMVRYDPVYLTRICAYIITYFARTHMYVYCDCKTMVRYYPVYLTWITRIHAYYTFCTLPHVCVCDRAYLNIH